MVFVLPGMGADQRMYNGPWRELNAVTFIDWPTVIKDESISSLAGRIVETARIPDGAVVVGSSFGGIVACEIAKIRKLSTLFLIGSAKSKTEISSVLTALRSFIDLAPLGLLQRVSGSIPAEISEMFSQSDPDFIRSMCRAIFEWDGLPDDIVTIRRIHGRYDLVIPTPTGVDLLLDGGHLIAMTHAEDCVRFIRANQAPEPTPPSRRGSS